MYKRFLLQLAAGREEPPGSALSRAGLRLDDAYNPVCFEGGERGPVLRYVSDLSTGTSGPSRADTDLFRIIEEAAPGSVLYPDLPLRFQSLVSWFQASDEDDLREALQLPLLHSEGMDGAGVRTVVVDGGVNLDFLAKQGMNPHLDVNLSLYREMDPQPGRWPVGHGTMCAYDVMIAAPQTTLVDHPVQGSDSPSGSYMDGFLSDVLLSYELLARWMKRVWSETGEIPSLVVNNSWSMYNLSWDHPVGDPANFSHNPDHPVTLKAKELGELGADLLFASGNCGAEAPFIRCRGNMDGGIFGTASSEHVLCVAGVSVKGERMGYSSRGPGCISKLKPDVSSFTHFHGSGVGRLFSLDQGSSAATAVASGVVSALRSRYTPDEISPSFMRNLVCRTAFRKDPVSFDYGTGSGVMDVKQLMEVLSQYAM